MKDFGHWMAERGLDTSRQLVEPDKDDNDGLPEGLRLSGNEVQFQCRSCERWVEWPSDVADFEIDNPANMCGGSPHCCP